MTARWVKKRIKSTNLVSTETWRAKVQTKVRAISIGCLGEQTITWRN